MDEPREDELIPHVSKEDSVAHAPLPVSDPNRNNHGSGKCGVFAGNPSASTGAGSHPNSLSPRRQDGQGERDRGDQASADKHRIGYPGADYSATAADEAVSHAGEIPLSERPEYETLFLMAKPE